MVAPEVPPARHSTRAVLLLLSWVMLASCAAPAPPASREPSRDPAKPAETPAPAPTPAPTPAPAPPPPAETKKDILVVVDPGGEENPNRTLVEAARAERERRAHAKPPVAVINDKSLKRHATGHLTIMKPKRPAEATAEPTPGEPVETAPATVAGEVIKDEAYWRGRALEIRQRWRNAADEVDELEQSAAGWRRRFYAENDRYVRDGQIKPEWDRVLDRLEKARAEAETAAKELTEFLEEGRVAGAYPGWLREGADLEPEKKPEPSNEHKAIEPPVAGEPP